MPNLLSTRSRNVGQRCADAQPAVYPQPGSGGGNGIAPVTPPTPPDVRSSASGGWTRRLTRPQDRTGQNFPSDLHSAPFSFLLRPQPDSPFRNSPKTGIHRPARASRARIAAAVATSGRFKRLFAKLRRWSKGSVSLVLPPFAPRSFKRFLATTASADFSPTLIGEISPGKVPRLSARIARLYRIRLSVTVGFRVP